MSRRVAVLHGDHIVIRPYEFDTTNILTRGQVNFQNDIKVPFCFLGDDWKLIPGTDGALEIQKKNSETNEYQTKMKLS